MQYLDGQVQLSDEERKSLITPHDKESQRLLNNYYHSKEYKKWKDEHGEE